MQLQEKAADFLDKFYQDREAQKAARIAAARNAAEAKGEPRRWRVAAWVAGGRLHSTVVVTLAANGLGSVRGVLHACPWSPGCCRLLRHVGAPESMS